MTGTRIGLALVLGMAAIAAVGCDARPAPPTLGGQQVRVLAPANEGEQAVGQRLEDAYSTYHYALVTSENFYEQQGILTKRDWARRERANLEEAQTFHYQVPASTVTPAPNLSEASEVNLAQQVVVTRKAYLQTVDAMVEYYCGRGETARSALADNIRRRFRQEDTRRYYFEADVPPATLRPTEVIPQAEQLYQEALRLHRQGSAIPGIADRPKEREALEKFRELVQTYPTSTRIAESAFYIGYIYKEYFHEDLLAVAWLERAFQWDPYVPKQARFEAATVLDLRLHNRSRALELYRDVLKYENSNATNVDFVRRRIEELTREQEP